MTEERKALPPPFPPAHQPVGFSPQMGQRVGCLPDIGSSCGQQLESFSVTWTALEENLGRDGLGSYSTMWKTAGQPPLTTKAACNGTATPFGTLPLKALWPALGWAEEHIRHHHNPRRDDRRSEWESGRVRKRRNQEGQLLEDTFLNCFGNKGPI